MKRFLLTFIKFVLPVFLLLLAVEIYVVYYPSTFNRKANYLHHHLESTEALVLGSSHSQNSLNPEWLHLKTVNLANPSQDVQIDSALLFKYVPKMKALKLVVLELDYFTLEEKNDKENFRLPWYKKFFGIELYPVSIFHSASMYASSPAFFNKVLIDAVDPRKPKYKLNEYGFIINDFPGVMVDQKYDSVSLANSARERLKNTHTKSSLENFIFNRSKLNAMINYCVARKLTVLLLSNPMYRTYINNEDAARKARTAAYLDSLKAAVPGLYYVDLENDPRFNVRDFKNDDHLNSNGAAKFTRIIDEYIRSISAD